VITTDKHQTINNTGHDSNNTLYIMQGETHVSNSVLRNKR